MIFPPTTCFHCQRQLGVMFTLSTFVSERTFLTYGDIVIIPVHITVHAIYICLRTCAITTTVEPPIKDAPNKGHLRIKDKIQSTKKSLSYSAI